MVFLGCGLKIKLPTAGNVNSASGRRNAAIEIPPIPSLVVPTVRFEAGSTRVLVVSQLQLATLQLMVAQTLEAPSNSD